jgi:kinesin family protein 5
VLREALCGYHGCIMAYGQTGSGKTHTLLNTGSKTDLSQAGLVPRLAADLFIQTAADAFAKYEVSVGMVQIYNEQVDDLLAADNHGLKIKQDSLSKGGGWAVEGIAWREVDSAAKLLESVTEARKRLVYAETKMNKHSSRSHCVMSLRVCQTLSHSRIRCIPFLIAAFHSHVYVVGEGSLC